MGSWVYQEKNTHRHDMPYYLSDAPGAKAGDIWRCNCGVSFKITTFDSGMQWDPYPTVIKWERVQQHGLYEQREQSR